MYGKGCTWDNRSGQKWSCPETVILSLSECVWIWNLHAQSSKNIHEFYICDQYLHTSGTNTRLKPPINVLAFWQNSGYLQGTKDMEVKNLSFLITQRLQPYPKFHTLSVHLAFFSALLVISRWIPIICKQCNLRNSS